MDGGRRVGAFLARGDITRGAGEGGGSVRGAVFGFLLGAEGFGF